MNRRLKAELWEIQVILYLILAQLVPIFWVKCLIWFWCVVTFIGVLVLQYKDHKEKNEQTTTT